MPSDDLNKMLKISERLNNQFKPIFEMNKQLVAVREITQPAMETINIFNEVKNSYRLMHTDIYNLPGVNCLISTMSDALSTYAIINKNDNFRRVIQPLYATASELFRSIDTSTISASLLHLSSTVEVLTKTEHTDEDTVDSILENAYSDPYVRKAGKEIIKNIKSDTAEYINNLNEAIELIDNRIHANKISKITSSILLWILNIIIGTLIGTFITNLISKPIPTTINYTINNYYNVDESNKLSSDIEAIKELNINTLAVINKNVKIYRSNSLKSGVCSKLQNGQLVYVIHKNKKWCNIKWIANGEEHYGWVQNYHLNSLIIEN